MNFITQPIIQYQNPSYSIMIFFLVVFLMTVAVCTVNPKFAVYFLQTALGFKMSSISTKTAFRRLGQE